MKNISNIKTGNNHIICRNLVYEIITQFFLPLVNVTGCLFNQLVYCMAIFTNKNK